MLWGIFLDARLCDRQARELCSEQPFSRHPEVIFGECQTHLCPWRLLCPMLEQAYGYFLPHGLKYKFHGKDFDVLLCDILKANPQETLREHG